MLLKVFLGLCLLHVVYCGSWKKIASHRCIGARNNQFKEFRYSGRNTFIIAMKLVHKQGLIGCFGAARSYWGCTDGSPTNIIVTDNRNTRMYPSPTLVSLGNAGWYDLGMSYSKYSPELVFTDPGFRYLYKGQAIRLWYGEDLYGITEGDNHGYTCMDVYVYATSI